MKLSKKIRDENDKKILFETFGRKPKHRCPICNRFSLWVTKKEKPGVKIRPGETECVMCELIKRTREEEANEKGNDSQPGNN